MNFWPNWSFHPPTRFFPFSLFFWDFSFRISRQLKRFQLNVYRVNFRMEPFNCFPLGNNCNPGQLVKSESKRSPKAFLKIELAILTLQVKPGHPKTRLFSTSEFRFGCGWQNISILIKDFFQALKKHKFLVYLYAPLTYLEFVITEKNQNFC